MKRRAFTLIELLILLAIIITMVGLLAPSLRSARTIARRVVCGNNLHHIGAAFHISASQENTPAGRPYPDPRAWPSVPQSVVPNAELYLCPDGPPGANCTGAYTVLVQGEEREGTLGIHVPFEASSSGSGLCEVFHRDGYDEYWFDDGWSEDVDDYLFHVTTGRARVATFMRSNPGGARPVGVGSGRADRIVSLCFNDKDVPGWESFRSVSHGAQITLTVASATNYGINARASELTAASHVVLLLDYEHLVANDGEDLAEGLAAAARHTGRLNVLFADQSVELKGPSELDPLINRGLLEP